MLIMFFELTGSSKCTPKNQHSTLQLWEARFFQKYASFCCNVEYVECVLGLFLKICFFLGICWICWMFDEHADPSRCTPPKENNIQHYSCEKHIFSKMCFFLLICWICRMLSWSVFENVLLSGKYWICWICWMLLELTNPFWMRPASSRNIQHIQHIQHFPRNTHIFGDMLSNIFNTSAERHFFWKNVSFSCNV